MLTPQTKALTAILILALFALVISGLAINLTFLDDPTYGYKIAIRVLGSMSIGVSVVILGGILFDQN